MSSALPLAKATAQSVLALTLVFSICFPLPLEKAHALDGRSAPAESNMGSSYVDNDATGNDADASPQLGGSASSALSHAAESGNPIVDWIACGTCRWMIDARGCLTIAPMEGADSGELSYWKDAPWYDYRDSITSAKIKDGVVAATTFRMFRDCSRLISVDLSGLDTSKVTEMGREDTWESGMFSGCTRLAYLDLSSLDTSNVTSMGCMFEDCSSLTSLDLSTFDTSNVVDMNSMFAGCTKLTSLDLSGFDTSKVTNMGSKSSRTSAGMFEGCSSLASLDLSSFDTSKVTDMSRMFCGCTKLTSLDLSRFDTSKVTCMDGMFWDCSGLFSLDLSGFDTSSVTSMAAMFCGCSLLAPVNLSGFNTSKVTNMSFLFEGCSRLSALDLSSFDTSNVTYMVSMFKGCSKLTSLDLSGFDTSSVTSMTAMFADCSSLSTLDLSGFNTSQVTDMSNLFSFCSSIASLDLSGLDTSEVEDMTHMFLGCSELTTLDLTSFDTSMAKSMDYMFYDCSSLKSVSLSQKFSFTGRGITRLCNLPKPLEKKGYTGLWVSATDGKVYTPDKIPNYAAATYTAQIAFPDVDYTDWYGNAVSFVSAKGLITGYTDGEKAGFFGVGDTLTRAQFATILWRNACPDEYAAYDPKTAVDTTGIEGSADGIYYTAAANWTVVNGYITGIDNLDGTFDFAADKPVSFEQMITILARITATPDEVAASRGDLSAFVDGDMASSWSRDSLAWAHDLGLVEGYNDPDRGKLLCPGENVERQRAATVLARAFTMGVLK